MFQPKSLYQLWCTTVHIVVYVYIFCIHSHYSALHPVPSQLYSFLKKASLWCPTYVHLFTNIQPMHEYHTGTQSCILCNSICAQLPIPCQTEAIYKAWLGVNIEWKCCARQGNKKLLIMLPFTETLLPREDMAPLSIRLSGSSFNVCIILTKLNNPLAEVCIWLCIFVYACVCVYLCLGSITNTVIL